MIGTLLLCLPSLFQGGAISIEMGHERHDYFGSTRCGHNDWWVNYGNKEPNTKLIPWCAFFSNMDHEIHQVTSGVRVTLTYLIRRKDGSSACDLIPRPFRVQTRHEHLSMPFVTCSPTRAFYRQVERLVSRGNIFTPTSKSIPTSAAVRRTRYRTRQSKCSRAVTCWWHTLLSRLV